MATRIREWNYGRKQPKITKKWLNSTVFILNHETRSLCIINQVKKHYGSGNTLSL